MNFYRGYRYLSDVLGGAVDKAVDSMSAERLIRGGAHTFLLGAAAFAALALSEDGYPSESEQAEIYACADRLIDKPAAAHKVNLSPACAPFTDEFATPPDGSSDYVLPSREAFIEDMIFTSRLEEERQEDFSQSFTLLSVALAGYGFIAFRRRLENPEPGSVADQAEEWLRSQPGQQ
jgi:hypothetical protein